jgi:uncharacterized membrane-anchored protein
MRSSVRSCLQLALLLLSQTASADAPLPAEPAPTPAESGTEESTVARLESELHFKSGDVALGENLATLHLGDSLRYLGPEDTEKVLVAWGNPPGSKSLGMLLPNQVSPFADESWAVIVTYTEDGHVEDEDAKDIDFNELLTDMKKDTEEANAERQKAGYPAVHLVGWAEPPHYDPSARKLYWAKELDFGAPARTLNYDIRVLGRKGVLELSAVAALKQLAMIKAEMPKVLSAVEFNAGNRYADFDPDLDEVAAYGIGALIAGKLVAKAGLFKIIIAALLASKKLIVAGVVALAVMLKRLLGRKQAEQPSPDAEQPPSA